MKKYLMILLLLFSTIAFSSVQYSLEEKNELFEIIGNQIDIKYQETLSQQKNESLKNEQYDKPFYTSEKTIEQQNDIIAKGRALETYLPTQEKNIYFRFKTKQSIEFLFISTEIYFDPDIGIIDAEPLPNVIASAFIFGLIASSSKMLKKKK